MVEPLHMEHTWGPSLGSHLAPSTGASLLTQLSGVPWAPSPPPRLGTRVGEPCHTLSRVSLPVGLVSTICTTKADSADPEPPWLQNKMHRLGPEPGSSVVVLYVCSVYFVCASVLFGERTQGTCGPGQKNTLRLHLILQLKCRHP